MHPKKISRSKSKVCFAAKYDCSVYYPPKGTRTVILLLASPVAELPNIPSQLIAVLEYVLSHALPRTYPYPITSEPPNLAIRKCNEQSRMVQLPTPGHLYPELIVVAKLKERSREYNHQQNARTAPYPPP